LSRDILIASVIGAQGLNGEVKVKISTAAPDALARYGALYDARGRTYEIAAFRTAKPGEAVIAFKGIGERGAAEALKGTELFVMRAMLPQTAEDEFYHADLVGLESFDREGRRIGKVAALHNFGAGDVIEIARADGDSLFIAFTRQNVPLIDTLGGRVEIAVPEDLEDNDHVE
jgi:16S rRNA processing protein RimM